MCKVEFVLKSYPNVNSPPRPIIDIAFKNPSDKNKIFPIIGLVDSGADNCTIPLKAAQTLGLDLKELNAKKIEMGCACGNKKFFGYQYKILVEFKTIEGNAMDKLIWVDFADSDTLPLIGRSFMGIFKQIAYNNEEKKGHFIGLKEED